MWDGKRGACDKSVSRDVGRKRGACDRSLVTLEDGLTRAEGRQGEAETEGDGGRDGEFERVIILRVFEFHSLSLAPASRVPHGRFACTRARANGAAFEPGGKPRGETGRGSSRTDGSGRARRFNRHGHKPSVTLRAPGDTSRQADRLKTDRQTKDRPTD